MADVVARAGREIDAPADRVFAALADYAGTRSAMLPEGYTDYEVLEGGQGPGTVIRYRMPTRGQRTRLVTAEVSEPVQHSLVEADRDSTLRTTWTVTPADDTACRVDVETRWTGGSGVAGLMERTFAPMGYRRRHEHMLGALAEAVRG